MRKFVSKLICLLLLLGLAMPTFAAGVTVTLTADSLPEVGGTLTVDTNALMNNGSITLTGTIQEVFKEKDIIKNAKLDIFDNLKLIELIEENGLKNKKEVVDLLWQLTYQK